MGKREAIVKCRGDHPAWTLQQIATEVGVTRERVRQILADSGLRTRGVRAVRLSDGKQWQPQYADGLSSHFVGGASELTACADLLRRGIPVYRACTFVGDVDLVVRHAGKYLGVEVRSARRSAATGALRYSMPDPGFDVLALVCSNGEVRYIPDIADWVTAK